ncbi:MAG TPA: hypothetical protein VKS60_02055 [Stellaceae bacterium]|nr:hypothetical protein [Stellaceae bacterium]
MAKTGTTLAASLAAVMSGVGLSVAAQAMPPVITLPGDNAFPESVTSSTENDLYAGSVAAGGILRARRGEAQARPWVEPGAFGSRSIFGVLSDDPTLTLWACSNDMSAAGIPGPGSATGSLLLGFDLRTAKGKVSARLPGDHTLCNDIAVGPDGAVYVTDMAAPQILRLRRGAHELETWLTDPQFKPAPGGGLDGIAFGSDGNLYVDTLVPGELYRIDVRQGVAGTVTKLTASRPLALPDALRAIGPDTFLLVEGVGRLDRVTVHGDTATIETLKDGLLGPTGVTVMAGAAWVAEGQLSYLFGRTNKGQSPVRPFRVSAVPLTAKARASLGMAGPRD